MASEDNILKLYHPVEKALLCNTDLRQNKHYIYPGLNLNDEKFINIETVDEALDFYEEFDLTIGQPLPCLCSKFLSEQVVADGDYALKLVKDKYIWKKHKQRWVNLAKIATRGKKTMSKIIEFVKKNDKITTLPFIITRLTDHLQKNPDKYFKGMYNWYYGNPIAVTTISDNSCLLFAGGENLSKLCISTYERKRSSDFIPCVTPNISTSLLDESPIYDIIPSKIQELIGIRQRDRCSFFLYGNDKDDDIIIKKCFSVQTNDYPYVSMDINAQEFCTVNSNRELQFWTPEYIRDCIGEAVLPDSDLFVNDNFVQVKYSSEENSSVYAVIDRANIYLFDKRLGFKHNYVHFFTLKNNYRVPCLSWNAKNHVEMCENTSLLISSVIENYWYVGFTHSCLLLDARAGFVQRWTHMLPQAPSVGCSFRVNKESHEANETILLGAQTTNDIVAIRNCWKSGIPSSHYIPVSLPDRIETLHDARSSGICYYPPLKKKFTYSLIGLAAYKKKKKIGVFSLVSTGDIFHHRIELKRDKIFRNKNADLKLNDNELIYLNNWEKNCINHHKEVKPVLNMTNIVDMTNLMDCVNIENNETYEWNFPNIRGKSEWKRSKKELDSYADFLAPWILHDFGLDDEDEWESEDDKDHEIRDVSYVKHWLSGLGSAPPHQPNDFNVEELLNNREKSPDIAVLEVLL